MGAHMWWSFVMVFENVLRPCPNEGRIPLSWAPWNSTQVQFHVDGRIGVSFSKSREHGMKDKLNEWFFHFVTGVVVVVVLQLICDPVICQIVASIKVEMPQSSALLSSGILKVMKWVQDCVPVALMFVRGITCIPFWMW